MNWLFEDIDLEKESAKIDEVKRKQLVLRDYQADACDGVYREWESHQSSMIVLPTGTGKSVCFSEVMRRWDRGGKIVLFAHRKELILQAVGHAQRAGLVAGIEMGSRWATGKEDVIVSTVQTLTKDMKCESCFGEGCDHCGGVGKVKRLTRFSPWEFGMLTIDEAHHATADTYRMVIQWFQRNAESKLLLVTATPKRTDKKGLKNVCQSVAYTMQLKEAIDLGWLVPIRQKFITVDGLDLSKVKTNRGDLSASGVEQAFIGTDEDEERMLHSVAKPTLVEANGRQVLVFSSGKEHAEKLTAAFNSYDGVTAAFVTESTKPNDRDLIVNDFRAGNLQVLVNCMVFTEGFDAPNASVVANCRATKSESLYAQIIGRVTRPEPGVVDGPDTPEKRKEAIAKSNKPFCTVLDFCGNSGNHKLVSVIDVLAGEDIDPLDLQAALEVAKETGETVDLEELAEKMKTARLDEEERAKKEKAKLLTTSMFATNADYLAVDVDLFAGSKFDSYNDPTPPTRGQQWMLKEYCGIRWKQSAKMSKREAGDRILTAKKNAKDVWVSGIKEAASISELKEVGEAIGRRKESDRLINDNWIIQDLRREYRKRLDELSG